MWILNKEGATIIVRNCFLLTAFVVAAIFSLPAQAQTSGYDTVGTLSCKVDPNIGFIIVGHQPMQCVYNQAPGALPTSSPAVV